MQPLKWGCISLQTKLSHMKKLYYKFIKDHPLGFIKGQIVAPGPDFGTEFAEYVELIKKSEYEASVKVVEDKKMQDYEENALRVKRLNQMKLFRVEANTEIKEEEAAEVEKLKKESEKNLEAAQKATIETNKALKSYKEALKKSDESENDKDIKATSLANDNFEKSEARRVVAVILMVKTEELIKRYNG